MPGLWESTHFFYLRPSCHSPIVVFNEIQQHMAKKQAAGTPRCNARLSCTAHIKACKTVHSSMHAKNKICLGGNMALYKQRAFVFSPPPFFYAYPLRCTIHIAMHRSLLHPTKVQLSHRLQRQVMLININIFSFCQLNLLKAIRNPPGKACHHMNTTKDT